MEYKGIKIKPGMVITTKGELGESWVVSVGGGDNDFIFVKFNGWCSSIETIENIDRIYEPPCGYTICSGKLVFDSGAKVELSLQEIADKFGVPKDKLVIKE